MGKPKIKWCKRELIRNPLCVALCLSEKQFDKEMRRMGIKNPPVFLTNPANATAHFFTSNSGEESVIVCLGNYKGMDPIAIYGMLLHEAVHVWQAVRDCLNEPAPSKEFEAYAIQCMAQHLMWTFNELTA